MGGTEVERLRSEIEQLEARYDGLFPPGVYAVLERLRRELAALTSAPQRKAERALPPKFS